MLTLENTFRFYPPLPQRYEDCCYIQCLCTLAVCFGGLGCMNGGTCIAPNVCECTPGFKGPKCEGLGLCNCLSLMWFIRVTLIMVVLRSISSELL